MKIVAVSDLHNSKDLYWKLWRKKGDMLIVAGDLTNLGRELELTSALDQIQTMNFNHKIIVFGNHETESNYNYYKQKYPDIIFLENEIIEVEGLKIYGSPYCQRFCSWAFPYDTQDECIDRTIPKEKVDIIITHEPPSHKDLSYVFDDLDIGNNELRKYLENTQDELIVISGHCHECGGKKSIINKARCYNVAKNITDIEL